MYGLRAERAYPYNDKEELTKKRDDSQCAHGSIKDTVSFIKDTPLNRNVFKVFHDRMLFTWNESYRNDVNLPIAKVIMLR